MRVRIRGVTYESVKEAANAHGVTIDNVYLAIRNGRTDNIGVGRGNHKNHKNIAASIPVSLFQGRLKFESISEAARELGYSQAALNRIIKGHTGDKSRENLQLRAMHYVVKNKRQV